MIRLFSTVCLIAIAFILSGCPDENPSKPDDITNVGGMKEFVVNSTTQVSYKIGSLGIVINSKLLVSFLLFQAISSLIKQSFNESLKNGV